MKLMLVSVNPIEPTKISQRLLSFHTSVAQSEKFKVVLRSSCFFTKVKYSNKIKTVYTVRNGADRNCRKL